MRMRRIKERAEHVPSLWEARQHILMEELRVALAETGLIFWAAALHHFFVRRGKTRNKMAMQSSMTVPTS